MHKKTDIGNEKKRRKQTEKQKPKYEIHSDFDKYIEEC
jgi:hypothetical protein